MGKTQRRAQTKGGGSKHDQGSDDSKKNRKGGKTGRKGRGGWSSQLETELSQLGLRVHEVAADGSCFFRSLADQLEGRSGDHRQLRKSIVQHIETNRDLYEPFIEDDEPFDDYIECMAEEGTWAGNLELQAASMELKINLKIYQAGQPPWIVRNFPPEDVPMLHISYHDGMHYNSVRLLDDYGTGPPEPILLSTIKSSNVGDGCSINKYADIDLRRVKDGTGCDDDASIVVALEKANGNVDAAIEAIVEELHKEGSHGGGGKIEEGDDQNRGKDKSIGISLYTAKLGASKGGELDKENCGEESFDEKIVDVGLEVSRGGKGKRVKLHLIVVKEKENKAGTTNEAEKGSSFFEEHKGDAATNKSKRKAKDKHEKKEKSSGGSSQSVPARNSRCPCGSTKKYKNCCGASKAARARALQNTSASEEEGEDTGTGAVTQTLQTLYI